MSLETLISFLGDCDFLPLLAREHRNVGRQYTSIPRAFLACRCERRKTLEYLKVGREIKA